MMLTTTDVALRLNVTPRTVQRLISSEGLPALRIGGQYRYREQELVRWLVRKEMRTSCTTTSKAASTRDPRALPSGLNTEAQMGRKFADLLKPQTKKKRTSS